jgi:hypothetical protein
VWFLLDSLRRLIIAALVIIAVACVVEVALRCQQPPPTGPHSTSDPSGLPRIPSRTLRLTLPANWSGLLRHSESGEAFSARTNSFALRGPEPLIPKPPGTLRVLCLGDETTLAPGLPDDEAYPAQLAMLLRRAATAPVEVVNAGMPGGCPLTATILYRQQLAVLAPDVVIVHVDVSDAADDLACRSTLRVDAAGRPAAVMHPTFEAGAGPLAGWEDRFAIAGWLRGRLGAELAPPLPSAGYDEFQRRLMAWQVGTHAMTSEGHPALAPLAHLQELWLDRPVRLVLSTCPDAWQASEWLRASAADASPSEALTAPAAAMQAAARRLGVPAVDATSAFLSDPDPARLFLSGARGLSREGHALYAEVLARALLGGSPPTAPGMARRP